MSLFRRVHVMYWHKLHTKMLLYFKAMPRVWICTSSALSICCIFWMLFWTLSFYRGKASLQPEIQCLLFHVFKFVWEATLCCACVPESAIDLVSSINYDLGYRAILMNSQFNTGNGSCIKFALYVKMAMHNIYNVLQSTMNFGGQAIGVCSPWNKF
jgi:hypothetical protein